MATGSGIEWTDATWNPIAGCTILSPGCTNCYAMRMAARLQAMGQEKYAGVTRKSGKRAVWTGRVNLSEESLKIPLKWKAPKRIFVNSMSDLFQEKVPADFILRVWEVMAATPQHQYQILTKRPERMADVLKSKEFSILPNVWLGTSVENAKEKHRIKSLKSVPAAVRFLSLEPLLGPLGKLSLSKIDWVIVGGESGPGARSIEAAWVDDIHGACLEHGTAFFFKQWGGVRKKKTGRTYKNRTWDEYPYAPGFSLAAE